MVTPAAHRSVAPYRRCPVFAVTSQSVVPETARRSLLWRRPGSAGRLEQEQPDWCQSSAHCSSHTECRQGSHRHRRRPPRHDHRSSAVAPWTVPPTAYGPTCDLALAPAPCPSHRALWPRRRRPVVIRCAGTRWPTRPSPLTSSPGAVPATRTRPARCDRLPPRPSSTASPPTPTAASASPQATTSGTLGRSGKRRAGGAATRTGAARRCASPGAHGRGVC